MSRVKSDVDHCLWERLYYVIHLETFSTIPGFGKLDKIYRPHHVMMSLLRGETSLWVNKGKWTIE